jgi:hypothetical protein
MDKKPILSKTADLAARSMFKSVSRGLGSLPGVSVLQAQ